MKTQILIVISVFLTVCNLKSYGDTTFKRDTITINRQKYIEIIATDSGQFSCLISLAGDTVVKTEDYYHRVEYIDINEDGDKDIRVYVISNTPNQCDSYLYDKIHKKFKYIENCDLDINKIDGKNLYYSYNSTGCSDMNWESYLSEIVDYKLIHLGHIEGQGCDYNVKENQQIIKIYKFKDANSEEKTIIEKLSYKNNIQKFDDKWNFIERYWTKNYSRFVNKNYR